MRGQRKAEGELCALTVFRETWKVLANAKDLEEAREKFKKLILNLILGE